MPGGIHFRGSPLPVVAADGNSLTAIESTIFYGIGAGWFALAANALSFNITARFGNAARGGATTPQRTAAAGSDVDPLLFPRRRGVVVMWEALNDFYNTPSSLAQCQANLLAYAAARRAEGWRVVMVTPIDANPAGALKPVADWQAAAAALAAWIPAQIPASFDGWINLYANAHLGPAGASNDATYFLADKVHLTAAGQAIVAGIAAPAILAAVNAP